MLCSWLIRVDWEGGREGVVFCASAAGAGLALGFAIFQGCEVSSLYSVGCLPPLF